MGLKNFKEPCLAAGRPCLPAGREKGLVALTSVLIISGVLFAIGLSAGYFSSSQLLLGFERVQSQKAYYAANLCAQDALMKLRNDDDYAGGETLTLEEGFCQILPIEGRWTLKVSADISNQVRKLEITIDRIGPVMIIDSWQEVADF